MPHFFGEHNSEVGVGVTVVVVVVSVTEHPVVVMVVVGEQVKLVDAEPAVVALHSTVTLYAVASEVQVDDEDVEDVVDSDSVVV